MPRTVYPAIITRVRRHLATGKLSYRQIARTCGVSDSYVREIEKRDRLPTMGLSGQWIPQVGSGLTDQLSAVSAEIASAGSAGVTPPDLTTPRHP